MAEATPNLQMILLKKQLSKFSEVEKRRLHSFLLTFYGSSMEAQGTAAVLVENLRVAQDIQQSHSTIPSEMVTCLLQNALLTLEAIQELSDQIGDLESLFQNVTSASRSL